MTTAAEKWADGLALWQIPQHILDAAPESPWGFPPDLFRPPKNPAGDHGWTEDTPSRRRALEGLDGSGTVIDVGCGAGASSLPLAARAELSITGVDQSADMLAAFAEEAAAAGVPHRTVEGTWPEVAAEVEPADVVICHHVTYNVPNLDEFAAALTDHARRRVVIEMTLWHPLRWANYLWKHFHGLDRPEGPNAEDAVAVLGEAGLDVNVDRWERPPHPRRADRRQFVTFLRRRLCLPAERESEIDELLGDYPRTDPTEVATIWWAGRA